jgi:hypothetical protein
MAVTAHAFPQFDQKLGTKAVNLSTDSLKVMLLTAYTYANSHTTMTDVLAAGTETSGTGYTTGGQALTSVTLTTSALVTTLTCANPSWAASTITAAFAVFYDAQGGTNATNFPFAYWDFGGSSSSSSGAFTLTINGSGLHTITAS